MEVLHVVLSRQVMRKDVLFNVKNKSAERECSGPVVEWFTRDQEVACLSLTWVTALCHRVKHINPCLVPVQPMRPFLT